MMYSRFFSFGCSYTNFAWPTWADIIAYDLDIPYQNWGISGIGNVAISSRMLECDIKNNFTKNDLIIVNWSSFHREDRIKNSIWQTGGNVFNNIFYDRKFLKKYWDAENDIVKNTTAIIMSNKIFNINYQSYMIDYEGESESNKIIYDFSNYQHYLQHMPKKNVFNNSNNSRFNKHIEDPHPDILSHLEHVKTIYKNLNLTLKTQTIEKYNSLQNTVIDKSKTSKENPNRNYDEFKKFFNSIDWSLE